MKFRIQGNQFIKDGKPIKIISGAVHYFRNLPSAWDDIFEKMKACGFNTVETYCAWNMHERKKGIAGRCSVDGKIHFNWQAYHLDSENIESIVFDDTIRRNGGSFYKFIFNVKDEPRDTFLRTDNFKKGFARLNGFNLGRYWEIGPQKTLYVPSALLKQGENELIIFESDGLKGAPVIEFVDKADLG